MELIVTVILVAVLASFAVYHYNNIMDEGTLNAAKGKLAALGGATARFILEQGTPAPSTGEDFAEGVSTSGISGSCDNNDIKGVFTCGYAEKSLSFAEGFDFSFGYICGENTGTLTVRMVPNGNNADNENFPSCAYFDPEQDKVIELWE